MPIPGNLIIKNDTGASTADLRMNDTFIGNNFLGRSFFFPLKMSVDRFPDSSYDAYRLFADGFYHSQMVIRRST